MIRVVPTGDLGLDVLLGGGWRLVKRFEERESATVVVRGGAGAGKTLMGIQVALELAHALGGDVAVGCVEILPTEYVGQLRSARPSLAAERVATLPASPAAAASDGPRVYVALLDDLSPDKPDLVTALEGLKARVEATGGNPVAFVVDSLIEGYGLGASTPRIAADDVLKFAARYGTALVLCEEVIADETSPWVFAADTVLQLGVESRERGRWIEVRKHRFGPSASGRHELDLIGREHLEVFPAPHAWIAGNRLPMLDAHAWTSKDSALLPTLQWSGALHVENTSCSGNSAFITADGSAIARGLANALQSGPRAAQKTLMIELDPFLLDIRGSTAGAERLLLPTTSGPARALRALVEISDEWRRPNARIPDRIVLGDLALVLGGTDGALWASAVQVFTALLVAGGWGVPLIAYDGRQSDKGEGRACLAAYADVSISVRENPHEHGKQVVSIAQRWPRQVSHRTWHQNQISGSQLSLDADPARGRNQ